jgi:hypothetical protein
MKGVVTIGRHSGLQKLMRAARRGKIPDERMVIIQMAERKAEGNRHYWHRHRRERYGASS